MEGFFAFWGCSREAEIAAMGFKLGLRHAIEGDGVSTEGYRHVCSADILQILNRDFGAVAAHAIDLRPAGLEADIVRTNERLYADFNNGVYQAGFAGTQNAYEEAVLKVFAALDWMEARLTKTQWLVGDQLTESDIRAFVTLIRFELAYYSLFKCNLRPLAAYPAVLAYLVRLLQIPAFAASVRADHIKAGYYSIKALNPGGIVPTGPLLDYLPRDDAPRLLETHQVRHGAL